MRLLRSRRFIHALIGLIVFLVVAGLYRLENSGHGTRILNTWEYGFRDSILTVAGRHNPPDNRLVFLGIDNASRSLTSLDLQNPDISPGSAEHRALSLMTEPWPWSREVYALLCERLLNGGRARRHL